MAIECQCPTCGQRFQAPETAAGKRAKCPKCGGVIQLGPAPAAAADAPLQWFARTADRKQHGPMTKAALDRLVAEGRLGGACELRRADWDHWEPVAKVYPQEASKEPVFGVVDPLAEDLLGNEPRLHPCPDCGKVISLRATQCPNCGCPIVSPAAPTLPRRAAPTASGSKRNRTLLYAAIAGGGVLLILLCVVLGGGIWLWNQAQPVIEVVEQAPQPPPPPVVDVNKPTPEQIAATMNEAAAAMAREVDGRFQQEYAAMDQLSQLQGSAEMLQSLAQGKLDPPKTDPKKPEAPKPPKKPYQSQYEPLLAECLAYLKSRGAESATHLATIWSLARQWAADKRSPLEKQLLEGGTIQ